MTQIVTRDSYLGSLVPQEVDYTYKLFVEPPRPSPRGLFSPNNHISLVFDMDYKMNYIERSVYNIFDLVKDIGGLVSGLHGFFFIFATIL